MPKERSGGKSSSSGTSKGIKKAFTFWQDREVHFDAATRVLGLRENTEYVYATFHHVEDTKGNSGRPGTLLVTNLRLIWWCQQRQTVNLSIGYYCVQKLTVQEAESKRTGGMVECVTIAAKCGASRFQFIFSVTHGGGAACNDSGSRSRSQPSNGMGDQRRLYATLRAVWNAYESTRVYRELRVRSAVVQNGTLLLLDGEKVISHTSGVSSVSKDEGHLGTFIVTNIRVVWFSTAEFFNVSVPYLQFVGLRSQTSKFGQALVIETSAYAGNFVLGFRVDPEEKLNEMYTEISTLWRTWTARPLLGMKVELHDDTANIVVPDALDVARGGSGGESGNTEHPHSGGLPGSTGYAPHERQMEGRNVLQEAPADGLAAYYAGGGRKGEDRRPVYDPSIGLAVEKLRAGVTMQSLWDTSVPS
ncbi:hypothetical protein, conserved [Leishmania tarentolae]|uniref:BBSome complex member BBS5 PH domain-containing protein n=1 Tax=Leishmania tarentolae TaxID=5689 RepID=A0A640KCN7_LEITA|nr:hypothetical protein, conserved [Leishmania tarentolae]